MGGRRAFGAAVRRGVGGEGERCFRRAAVGGRKLAIPIPPLHRRTAPHALAGLLGSLGLGAVAPRPWDMGGYPTLAVKGWGVS